MGRFDLSPEEITEGPIPRALLVLSAPLFVQNMVRVAQQVVDLFWVGRYSSDAVAAIGLASPVVWFLLSSTVSASFVGTQVLVSQRVGADDVRGARRAAFTGLLLTLVLSVGVGALMFLNVRPLLELVTSARPTGGGGDLVALATRYLEVISLGIVFAGLSDTIEAAFVGRGESRAAMYMNVASVTANLSLDPFLIFGLGPFPSLGIRGAALATVAGYTAGFLLGVAFVLRGRAGGILSRAAATVDLGEFRAAYTVGSRVSSLAFRTLMSLSNAAQSIVGQNLGAGNLDRATSTTWTGVKIGTSVLTVFAVGQWLVPELVVNLFVPEMSGRSFAFAVAYLQFLAVGYPAKGVFSLVRAGFNGARRTKTTMVASVAQTWLLQLPIAAGAGITLGFGAIAVFWARPLSIIVSAVVLAGYYLHSTNNGMYSRAAERVEASPDD
ncbi:MATE family efflux transporter [Halobacteriales archaeon SW_6_65_15]|nr:MAG: MATE family efflux transporter [Halobacteriales archaeon SW_6_65_15]